VARAALTAAILILGLYRARLTEQGADMAANTPDEFRTFIKDEMGRLSVVIPNANIHLDWQRRGTSWKRTARRSPAGSRPTASG
jgi:hypothetical protein